MHCAILCLSASLSKEQEIVSCGCCQRWKPSKVGLSKVRREYFWTFHWFLLLCETFIASFVQAGLGRPALRQLQRWVCQPKHCEEQGFHVLGQTCGGNPNPRGARFCDASCLHHKKSSRWLLQGGAILNNSRDHDTAIGCDRHLCNAAIVRHRWRATFNRQSMPRGLQLLDWSGAGSSWSSSYKGRLQACIPVWNSR